MQLVDIAARRVFFFSAVEDGSAEAAVRFFASASDPEVERSTIDDPENLRSVITGMLLAAYRDMASGEARDRIATSILLTSAALCDSWHSEDPLASRTLLAMRAEGWDMSAVVYRSAFRWLLRRTGRRVKSPFTEDHIIAGLGSMFDGYFLRHASQSRRFPVEPLVEMMWQMAIGMTETGVLNSDALNTERMQLALAVLPTLVDELPMDLETAEVAAAIKPGELTRWFSSRQDLFDTCLDAALATRADLRQMLVRLPNVTETIVAELYACVASVASDYPKLVRACRKAAVWGEVTAQLEEVLVLRFGKPMFHAAHKLATDTLRAVVEDPTNTKAWAGMASLLSADAA